MSALEQHDSIRVNSAMLNIVVIEDNHALRDVLCELLRSEGYKAFGAFDAHELNEILMKQPVDLLLLDIGLPGEDGFSVARRLRKSLPELFIIMTTARGGLSDRVRGYSSGADVYLTKPVAPDELLAAVGSAARRVSIKRSSAAAKLPTLDITAQTLLGQEQVHLTRTEVLILRALLASTEQIAHTHTLLELDGRRVDERSKASIEVQITHLRKKLEQACQGELRIRAVRGTGYQLLGRLRMVCP